MTPAGGGAQRARSPGPTGLLWAPCPAAERELWPPLPTHSLLRRSRLCQEKVHWVEHTYSFPSHTPLPSPFQTVEGKFRFQVRHAPTCLHRQRTSAHTHAHTHTHTRVRALSLEDGTQQEEGWTRAQVWASGGISPPAPSRGSALMDGNAHMHTSAPQAEDGAMGLGPGPGAMGSSLGDPGREVGWGLYIWLQMWLLPRLKKKKKKSQPAPDSCQSA